MDWLLVLVHGVLLLVFQSCNSRPEISQKIHNHADKIPEHSRGIIDLESPATWFVSVKETLINSEFPQHMDVLLLSVAAKPLIMRNKMKSH
jgi:hypothetical protein